MTKVKNAFSKVLLIVLMLIMCITLSACGRAKEEFGDDFDDDEFTDPDDDGTTSERDVDLFGVKVLRRPLRYDSDGNLIREYDFDSNVTDKEGNYGIDSGSKDFFYSLSGDIIELLFTTYGNFNTRRQFLDENLNQFEGLLQESQNEVVKQLASDFKGANKDDFKYWYDAIRYPIIDVEDKGEGNYVVTASSEYAWKWSLPYNAEDYKALVSTYNNKVDGAEFVADGAISFTYSDISEYYNGGFYDRGYPFNSESFHTAYVNEDYKNALAYSIYSIVLGTPMATINVTYPSGNVQVKVGDYETTAQALNDVRDKFKKTGAYVGLTELNKRALKTFILQEVIGGAAIGFGGRYSNYHYTDVVDAIVDYCATQTVTGAASSEEGGGGQTSVGEAWLASEIVDYPYTSFFTCDAIDPFLFTNGAYEYQSFVLMPSRDDFEMTDLWLDFKYDADRDGDDHYNPETTLEIDVIVRWNKGDGSPIKQLTKHMSVKDGPADIYEDGTTLTINFDGSESEGGFGESIKVKKFKTPPALKGKLLDGFIVSLNGITDARRYYQVLDGENGGVYGVLNEKMYTDSYCEVAFDVKKSPTDSANKNYAFYLAINSAWQELEYPDDPEWH